MTEAGSAESSFEKLWLIINENCLTSVLQLNRCGGIQVDNEEISIRSLLKDWINNEKCMTKCSSYTGVEKFIDLSEHC